MACAYRVADCIRTHHDLRHLLRECLYCRVIPLISDVRERSCPNLLDGLQSTAATRRHSLSSPPSTESLCRTRESCKPTTVSARPLPPKRTLAQMLRPYVRSSPADARSEPKCAQLSSPTCRNDCVDEDLPVGPCSFGRALGGQSVVPHPAPSH